eukprot:1289740-Pleurochrysis_carterae.AAC.1
MASPRCGRTSEKFMGGARDAAAGLERAVRAARRAAGGATENIATRPPPVRWAALGLSEWKKQGALSIFHMRVGGRVMFTPARDVARADTNASGEER